VFRTAREQVTTFIIVSIAAFDLADVVLTWPAPPVVPLVIDYEELYVATTSTGTRCEKAPRIVTFWHASR
jgi:hypothetical protein